MNTPTPHGAGGFLVFGVALAAAVLVTVWWGFAGLGTEDFGSNCHFYFGETGPQAEHCHRVNDRAEAWLPWLVSVAWTSAVLSLFLPRRFPPGRRTAAGLAVACLVVAVVLGVHAMAVSTPLSSEPAVQQRSTATSMTAADHQQLQAAE
ncbi:hypothetical protein OHS70_26410 [Streptomyces sp. NBC_00390]|uniref:hypothetical protein n=1 Tax=Streptomyces sp. NBC_00390 TaxID=2975736 RepID=UPI002E24DFEC